MPKTLVLLLLCPLLGGCRYNFFPVIPAPAPLESPVRLRAELTRQGDTLRLQATLQGQQAGYLSVVWRRGDLELGRDSVYLDAAQRQAHFELPAPRGGDYRAMLLFDGTLLRQLDLNEAQ